MRQRLPVKSTQCFFQDIATVVRCNDDNKHGAVGEDSTRLWIFSFLGKTLVPALISITTALPMGKPVIELHAFKHDFFS